jgi:two-component system, sensor histidine kinase PdtaS
MKTTHFFLLFLFFWNTSISKAQNTQIGQLEAQFNASPTPEKAITLSKAYQEQAKRFSKSPQFDLANSHGCFYKAIQCLDEKEPAHFQELSQVNLDFYCHLLKTKVSLMMDTCIKNARFFFDKIPNKSNAQLLEYNLLIEEAEVSFRNGTQQKGNDLINKAFAWIQEQKNNDLQARYFLDKGTLYGSYRQTINDTTVINCLLRSELLYEKSNDPKKYTMLMKLYTQLAWYYNVCENNDLSDVYFEKQKALLPILNSLIFSMDYYAKRANNYLRRKEYAKAKPLLLECQNLSEKHKLTQNGIYIFNSYLQGVMALDFKQYDFAIKSFEKGLDMSLLINNIGFINDGYSHLATAYETKGNYKKALYYIVMWSQSITDEYDKTLSKSLQENELKLNIEKQKNQLTEKVKVQNLYICALFIGLFLLTLLYRNYRLKQKTNVQLAILNKDLAIKNALLDKRNAENELLLKEIHHRVKNNLEVVSSLLALQSAKIDNPDIQDAMLSSQNRVNSMGILHQKLYQGEHLAFIEMKNYFINLSQNILNSYDAAERITIDCDMNEINLDVDTAIPIGLIVNELLTNSLKYAFEKGQNGNVKLSLEDKGDNLLQLKIADNGIGKSLTNKPQGTGFGTQLVDLLTKQLDGIIHQEINNGTMIYINFKRVKSL